MIRQVVAVAIKELQLIARDRPALALLFLMPVFFILVMSVALQNVFEAGTRASPVHLLIVDEDQSPVSAGVVEALGRVPGIVVVSELEGRALDRARAEHAVSQREYPLALVLGDGLSAPSATPDDEAAVLIADPATQRQIVGPARGAIDGALRIAWLRERLPQQLRELVTEWSIEEGDAVPPPDVLDDLEASYAERMELDAAAGSLVELRFPSGLEPEQRPTSTQQSVPGYTIFGVFFITLTLATSVVRERADGLLMRLWVTPISRSALLLGKLLPYVFVNLVQIASMFAVGVVLFELALGSLSALLVLSLALAATATALGLFVAAVSRTEAQVGALAVALSLTLAALGGIMVPSYVMPGPMRTLAAATPHAWALQGYHDVMLRGGGIDAVMPEVAILLGFAVTLYGLSAALFRYR